MKTLLPALTLALLLTACGGQPPASSPASSPAGEALDLAAQDIAEAILEAGTFSEELEAVEQAVAYTLYGLDEESVLDCAAFLSTGGTAEECTVLIMKDEDAAKAALEGFQARVEDQLEALVDYQPAEIPKLEKAAYGTRAVADGVLVYLVVAESTDGVFEAINA